MKTKSILTGFKGWQDAPLEALGHAVVLSMTGNPYFPSLASDTAKVTDATAAFSDALAAAGSGSGLARAERDEKKAALVKALHVLAVKVNLEADGNAIMLESSGFPMAREGGLGRKAMPDGLILESRRFAIKVSYRKLEDAFSYVIRYTEAPVTASSVWTEIHTGLGGHLISGLKAGTEYAVCMAPVGEGTPLLFSDPVTVIVMK